MFLYGELMSRYKLLHLFSGMHGSRRLYIDTGMPGAHDKPIPILIFACLLDVA